MSDANLRSSLIRLASAHPEFRSQLLPLLKAGTDKQAGTGNTPFELWTTKALMPLLKRADHQVTGVTVETDKNKMVISMEIPDASDAAKKETEGDPNTFRDTFLNNVAQEPIEAALQKFFGTECTIGQGTDSGDGVYQVSVTFSR